MQAVMWDPKYTATAASNDADIVNLNVDVTFSGATITIDDDRGGDALAGWKISVTSGEDAVEGDNVPEELDEDGMAAFTATVGADDLPVSYTFAVAADQADAMDGGENYEGSDVEYEHNGLSLAATMDAGMIEVNYTTQTLKVYVHHERDQVKGYTGNILGGDERMSDMIDVDIRYIDDSGRSRAFTSADSVDSDDGENAAGVYTFSNVPADEKVIVQAEEAAEGIMLLDSNGHSDELATFRNMKENGVTGGAFGDMGGYSHTVTLCPLEAVDPTAQDHGECGSFAYVSIHNVSGLVWKRQVVANAVDVNDDSFTVHDEDDPVFVPGITVNLDPVDGKNLAGDFETYTSAEEDDDDTEDIDETHQFDFGEIAAGVYAPSVSDGWRVRLGGKATEDMVGNALNPLDGDEALDVTPATGIVYGYVRDVEEFPVAEVTVTVNGVAAETDVHGRYIAEGISPQTRTISRVTHRNSFFVETDHEGSGTTRAIIAFVANSPVRQDIELSGKGNQALISGTVTASGSGAPVAGAEILVDGEAPNNKATRGVTAGKLVTDADGFYTAEIDAKDIGESATVTVQRAGMSFVPAEQVVPAHGGADIKGIDFTGFVHATITGRVKNPDGNAMGGVSVTATNVVADAAGDDVSSTTNARGTFVLSVPFGAYDIEASADDHTFKYPNDNQRVSVAPGQTLDFGDIQAMSPGARNLSASRARMEDDDATEDVDESERYTGTINVSFIDSSEDVPDGYEEADYQIQTNTTGEDADWTDVTGTAVQDDGADIPGRFTIPSASDGDFMVRVVATAIATNGGDPLVLESAPATVDAINPAASGVSARRQAAEDSEEAAADGDFIHVSWSAVTNANSAFRVVAQVSPASTGGSAVWVVLNQSAITGDARMSTREFNDTFSAGLNVATATGTGSSVTVTAAEINAAIMVAVESVQGDASEDNEWKRSAADELAAKPAADNGG
jgi:hypothetical protein